MLESGQLLMLVSPKGKRYFVLADPEASLNTHDGTLSIRSAMEQGFGGRVHTHKDKQYLVLKPALYDFIKSIKRSTQIMYPKEIGYIAVKLGVGPGRKIIEAGSGSGSLTTALAWFAGDTGRVITYERREDFYNLCTKNLERCGLQNRVEQNLHDIEQGFLHTGADALFLDVRTPWLCLGHIPAAVIPGAPVGFLLPTANQVQALLQTMEDQPFGEVEVMEILIRRYKPVAERFRPEDRMVGHTGFLVFARCMHE
ncbi:MAG: tRNA (adenine-N1)-methyltransferase [Desulfonatronovibrionaceae bacterium]